MANDNNRDGIDAPVAELAAVFHELDALSFPGVNAESLDAAMAVVASQVDEVERLSRLHANAVEELHARQRSLREHAQRGHAYAMIFAKGNADLTARLDGIDLADAKAAPPKKRRVRRAKSSEANKAAPLLALDDSAAGEPAAPVRSAAVG
jgi:hypothetical protein